MIPCQWSYEMPIIKLTKTHYYSYLFACAEAQMIDVQYTRAPYSLNNSLRLVCKIRQQTYRRQQCCGVFFFFTVRGFSSSTCISVWRQHWQPVSSQQPSPYATGQHANSTDPAVQAGEPVRASSEPVRTACPPAGQPFQWWIFSAEQFSQGCRSWLSSSSTFWAVSWSYDKW